jgi:hypothetical protein
MNKYTTAERIGGVFKVCWLFMQTEGKANYIRDMKMDAIMKSLATVVNEMMLERIGLIAIVALSAAEVVIRICMKRWASVPSHLESLASSSVSLDGPKI